MNSAGDQVASLSYIIPTYNNLELLERCLQSIIAQAEEEDRIVIIDDGGSDGTYKYLKGKYGKDQRFVILHQVNQGQGPARNYGIEMADTDYIWFVDSDDLLMEGSRQKFKKILEEHSLDILFFDYMIKKTEENNKKVSLNIKYMDKFELILTDHFPWNKIFKTELFREIRFPNEKIRFQDHGTIPKVINEASEINYVNEAFYLYDLSHDTNISKNEKLYNHMYISCDYLVDYFEKVKNPYRYLELLLINTYLFNRIYSTRKISFQERKEEFFEIHRYMDENVPDWKTSYFLSFSFWRKYKHLQDYKLLKLFNAKVFSKSPLVSLLLLHPFNSMKTLIKESLHKQKR